MFLNQKFYGCPKSQRPQLEKNIKEDKKATSPFCSFSITDSPAIQLKVAANSWDDCIKTQYNKKNYVNNIIRCRKFKI